MGEEADRLFAPRKSMERAFYQMLDAFEAAEKAAREGLVLREVYEPAQMQYEEAKRTLERLQQDQRALTERRLQHQRFVRIMPMLGEREKIERLVEYFAELPSLRRGFPQDVRDALAARHRAQ